MTNCAEVEQIKDVHFEELSVGKLLECVLELCLLTAKVRPEGVAEF